VVPLGHGVVVHVVLEVFSGDVSSSHPALRDGIVRCDSCLSLSEHGTVVPWEHAVVVHVVLKVLSGNVIFLLFAHG